MAGFNSSLHPHVPAGSAGGGQFAPKAASSSQSKAAQKPATAKKPAAKKQATAKGRAPAGPGKNGRYTKKQFGELQSLLKQHQHGKKLTAAQAHAEHVAHELHLRHEGKSAPKPKAAKRATPKPRKAAPKKPPAKAARTAVPRAVRN